MMQRVFEQLKAERDGSDTGSLESRFEDDTKQSP